MAEETPSFPGRRLRRRDGVCYFWTKRRQVLSLVGGYRWKYLRLRRNQRGLA